MHSLSRPSLARLHADALRSLALLSYLSLLSQVCRLTGWESLLQTRWEEELLCLEDLADTALRFFYPDKVSLLR